MFENLGNMFVGFLDTMMTILWIIIGGAVIFAVGYYVQTNAQFKHIIQIRQLVNGRRMIIHDRFRIFKDSDGIEWYQLKKSKKKLPKAPPEAIEISVKGQKIITVFELETGDFVWATDESQAIPQNILAIKNKSDRKSEIKKWTKENKGIVAFNPLSTNQKQILVNGIAKAKQRKSKNWRDIIHDSIFVGGLLILVISLMVFYEDIASPVLEMKDKQIAEQKIMLQIVETQKEIKNDIQVMKEQIDPKQEEEIPN